MSMGLWGMGMTISGTSVLGTETLPHQYHEESTNPLTNTYRTKDDQFVSLAFLQSDRYWPEFCLLVDKLDWLADERFAESASRDEHRAALVELLDDLFAGRPLDEWVELLSQQDGPWDVLLPAGRVRHDAQAQANGYVQPVAHDGDGEVVLVPAPAQFDGEVPELGRAPRFGEHTEAVLRAQGFDEQRIAESAGTRHHPVSRRGG